MFHVYESVWVELSRIQQNFEPMQRQVEAWRQAQITDAAVAELEGCHSFKTGTARQAAYVT